MRPPNRPPPSRPSPVRRKTNRTSPICARMKASRASGLPPSSTLTVYREASHVRVVLEQRERQRDIYARADSLILSTTHVEIVFPDETQPFRDLATCSGPRCELLVPTTGETSTLSLGDAGFEPVTGDAETIGSAHGITLVSEQLHGTDANVTSLGAWMEHGSFGLNTQRAILEDGESGFVYTIALGELTGQRVRAALPPAAARRPDHPLSSRSSSSGMRPQGSGVVRPRSGARRKQRMPQSSIWSTTASATICSRSWSPDLRRFGQRCSALRSAMCTVKVRSSREIGMLWSFGMG